MIVCVLKGGDTVETRTIIDPGKIDKLKGDAGILSDRQLAELAGINVNTFTNVVRKGKPFDSKTLDRLATALRCSPLDLQTVAQGRTELFSQAQAVALS